MHEEEVRIGAREDENPHARVIRIARVEQPDQPTDERAVDEVRGRVVDRDRGDAVVDEHAQRTVRVVHPSSPRAADANASSSRAMSGPAGV